jgi:hypothetical protein
LLGGRFSCIFVGHFRVARNALIAAGDRDRYFETIFRRRRSFDLRFWEFCMPRLHPTIFVLALSAGLVAGSLAAPIDARGADSNRQAAALARQILDNTRPEPDRKKIIADHPELSLDLLTALVAEMPPHDSKEEYRRIPWIWRVAVAAAKRNDVREMKPIVEFSLPQPDQPLRDWEAVVIGGGIINGIGLVGAWPNEQMEKIVADDSALRSRWDRVLELAAVMADNQNVFKGTRYDALRIIGLDSWDRRGAQLSRYLEKGVDDELQ